MEYDVPREATTESILDHSACGTRIAGLWKSSDFQYTRGALIIVRSVGDLPHWRSVWRTTGASLR